MAGTVQAFDFENGIGGLRVVARNPDHICPGCVTDEEIDTNIHLLKEDLDMVGRRMKAALRTRRPALPKSR